jgi:orotidine-5'-phosphate decarboxylase
LKFKEKLLAAAHANNSWLCVGLDPDISRFPEPLGRGADSVLEFNRAVIEATADLVCAYKPNAAFYEIWGAGGWEILRETVHLVPKNIPVILDFKRGDIGNTARMYAAAAFETLEVDAVTVNPYLGRDSLEPFLRYGDKGVFVLCLTSNESSADLQKKIVLIDEPPNVGSMTPQSKARTLAEFFNVSTVDLYLYVARLARQWNRNDNVGLVAGATSAVELEKIRGEVGQEMPILVPGVGNQGGDLERALGCGSNEKGELAIINLSRGVIYAGKGEDYRNEIRLAAEEYRSKIELILSAKRR